MSKTDEKVEAVKNVKESQNIHKERSFLGLITFHGKFVLNLATISALLYNLMRKDVSFKFDKKCLSSPKKKTVFGQIPNLLLRHQLCLNI